MLILVNKKSNHEIVLMVAPIANVV